MELNRIKLHNFKCFDAVDIRCSKFTLLTGANSSGKSTIIYSVLGALQTKDFPFYFSPNGGYVNMGDFEEIARNHAADSQIGINLELRLNEKDAKLVTIDGAFTVNPETKLPRLSALDVTSPALQLSVSRGVTHKVRYNYDPEKDPNHLWKHSPEFRNVLQQLFDLAEKSQAKKTPRRKKVRLPKKGAMENYFEYVTNGEFTYNQSDDILRKTEDQPFLRGQLHEIANYTREFERSFNYISSFRLPPERTYYQRTKAALKVEKYGENWVEQIVEWEQAKSKILRTLKESARSLKLIDDLKSSRHAGGRFEIRVVPHTKCVDSSLVDVGFGISQFLPILVADAQLGKNSTLFVSQPEIHLHPSVQADFANYLVKNQRQGNKRYVIETHSEYLLNRFRLMIAKGEINEDDVSVYYLNRGNGRARCHELRFTERGQIKGAPAEFFKTYMMDVMDIAMHA